MDVVITSPVFNKELLKANTPIRLTPRVRGNRLLGTVRNSYNIDALVTEVEPELLHFAYVDDTGKVREKSISIKGAQSDYEISVLGPVWLENKEEKKAEKVEMDGVF